MSTVLSYKIHTVTPYINWIYFFHAWGFQPRYAAIANIHGCDACRAMWLASFPVEERNKASEAMQLFKEANRMLDVLDRDYEVRTIFKLCKANSDGDNLVIEKAENQFMVFPLLMGFRHHYIIQVPGFLMPKTSFSLLRLAKAESAQDCLEVVAGTPYAKVLAGVLPAAGQKLDYLKCEHAFQSYFYTTVLAQIDRDLSGRSAADTKRLFRMEAEIYNLDLLFRAKAFFSPQLTPEDLKKLMQSFPNHCNQS